jgi:hypothetical protein
MKGAAKDYSKAVNKLQKDLRKEFGDHEVESDAIDAYWDQVMDLNKGYSEDLIELRFELHEQVSREEWAGLFPTDD